MPLDNDTRGWIMTALSGVACVAGASIINVDLIVRRFTKNKNFKIQDSNAFLSSSLSLSFGVMLFSSLYNMLPEASNSLKKGGFSPKAAAWTLIACFLGGVLGIQVLSRVMHHFMPSHVVDCDHSHRDGHGDHDDEENDKKGDLEDQDTSNALLKPSNHSQEQMAESHRSYGTTGTSPALSQGEFESGSEPDHHQYDERRQLKRRPSLHSHITSKVAKIVSSPKPHHCDEHGTCYGFTGPCNQDCFESVQARGGSRVPNLHPTSTRSVLNRSNTAPHSSMTSSAVSERQPLLHPVEETTPLESSSSEPPDTNPYFTNAPADEEENGHIVPHARRGVTRNPQRRSITHDSHYKPNFQEPASPTSQRPHSPNHPSHSQDPDHEDHHNHSASHHHHIPTNAFLSIGLQTSLAIALHKLPEGFITYSTNHANPTLGFSVFISLFFHNITEGFAMALPLYLAINSRWKAMFWSALLGGVSQPIGAGMAAIWLGLSGDGGLKPDEGGYGCLFAVTAGIMTSVALQLFSESLDLTHNRNLCMVFAFVGMGILGISSALTA